MRETVLLGMTSDEIWARTAGTVLVINTIITGIAGLMAKRNKQMLERMELKARLDHVQQTRAISKTTRAIKEVSDKVDEQNGEGVS